ncbi:AcrR family transcriptional regulator [Actinoplanes lutulentus]|uniref:TetR family transcriptional regulator n=1 Tax=Actinoplanes lutulentus TaxID=1287878 RepID=A0A327Z392_9ACTN|nr:TetR/AcrR family transcriptional regulator [Actinoplanes lutulentus]MBB2940543.1 AcrR family transcriptional regulator [Actinoplanes lutulentus]RAK24813.1 TetR family transcriptional regulator [Actinoplanes lutulentus]
MGLREQKAERTRTTAIAAALQLFDQHGYDRTTMEQIAEAAQIGVATLYRHFSGKDQILLDPLIRDVGSLGIALRARPDGEPLPESLGHAVKDSLSRLDGNRNEFLRLRKHLDTASGPQARLWELRHQERLLLTQAIADRSGAAVDEMWVTVAAHTTMTVWEMALELHRGPAGGARTAAELAGEVLCVLGSDRAVIPQ